MPGAAVSLAVAATVANIGQWGGYIAASVLLALTYAMIGAILAPLFGRVAGVLVAFLIPFLDLGIAQDPMLHAAPPTWARFLPGYGGFHVLTNSVLTHGAGSPWPLALRALTPPPAVAPGHDQTLPDPPGTPEQTAQQRTSVSSVGCMACSLTDE